MKDPILGTIQKALPKGRLAYKILDQNFQASGGGTFDYRPYLPTADKPGKWLPEIADPEECVRGWHFTLDPLVWPGCVVFLVETKEEMTQSQKQAFPTGRLLKRIWHDECVDVRLWVRIKAPHLSYANLRYANLRSANLRYADLSYANLSSANLSSADLSYADLSSAYLSYAYRLLNDAPIPGWRVERGVLVKE